MSKDGPKPGESNVSPADLTDTKREISSPNELHLESLCISEKSDTRHGESKLNSPCTQESRHVNDQQENRDRDEGQSIIYVRQEMEVDKTSSTEKQMEKGSHSNFMKLLKR